MTRRWSMGKNGWAGLAVSALAVGCFIDIGEVLPPSAAGGGCSGDCGGSGGVVACPCAPDGRCELLQTDPRHCGACDVDCGSSDCVAGRCAPELIYEGMLTPRRLALDDRHVYFICSEGSASYGQVCRVFKAPEGKITTSPTIISPTHDEVYEISVSEAFVRWCQPGQLVSYRKDDDTINLEVDPTWTGTMRYIAADAAHAHCLPATGVDSATVVRVDLQGSDHVLLPDIGTNSGLTGIALVDGRPYVVRTGSALRIYALLDEADATWASYSPNGTVTALVGDDTYLYYTRKSIDPPAAAPGLVRLRVGFAGSESLLWEGEGANDVALGGDWLYVIADDGRLVKIGKDGTGGQILYEGPPGSGRVAVDESHVYWSHAESRKVMRLPR